MDFEPHPFANAFPMLKGKAFEKLCADIKENGCHEPVIIYEDKILDGRNRYKACIAVNVEPNYELFHGNSSEALNFVRSLNIHRRHLTEGQLASSASKAAKLSHGGDRKSASWRVDTVSREEAAKRLETSTRSVARAHAVHTHGIPKLIEALDRGLLTVNAAEEISRMPPAEQAKFGEVFTGARRFPQVKKELDAAAEKAAKQENIAQREIAFEAFLRRLLIAIHPDEKRWIARFRHESPGLISDGLAHLFYGDLYLFYGEED